MKTKHISGEFHIFEMQRTLCEHCEQCEVHHLLHKNCDPNYAWGLLGNPSDDTDRHDVIISLVIMENRK